MNFQDSKELEDLLEANKTSKGGYTKSFLNSIDVPWPPPKGWKRKMIDDSWAWKPDYNVINIAKARKRKAKVKKKQIDGKRKREELLEYFGLHKYASWTAIAEMICKETGRFLPGDRKACRHLAIKYSPGQPKKRGYKPRMSAEKFYASNSWREVRYIALKQSGGCCTLCGARASDGVSLHVDHIIPRSVSPEKELDLNNLQILCEDCNLGKSNRDEIDWS